jgi:hypothetical protein
MRNIWPSCWVLLAWLIKYVVVCLIICLHLFCAKLWLMLIWHLNYVKWLGFFWCHSMYVLYFTSQISFLQQQAFRIISHHDFLCVYGNWYSTFYIAYIIWEFILLNEIHKQLCVTVSSSAESVFPHFELFWNVLIFSSHNIKCEVHRGQHQ